MSYQSLAGVINSLEKAIYNKQQIEQNINKIDFLEHDSIIESMRDSLIQRFEFTTDLFWKYLKKYFQANLVQPVKLNSPRSVITEACKAKILSENDAELLIEMIKNRNLTSHIYREEMADRISINIPQYLEILKNYIVKLKP